MLFGMKLQNSLYTGLFCAALPYAVLAQETMGFPEGAMPLLMFVFFFFIIGLPILCFFAGRWLARFARYCKAKPIYQKVALFIPAILYLLLMIYPY